MPNEINSGTTSIDQEKAVAAKLLQRAHLRLVAASICDKVKQPKGTGTTVYFIRYKRMNLPMATLAEGVAPPNNTIALEQVQSGLDQWGDKVTITDVAQLTTLHPLMQEAQRLLADNAQRVIDREVQLILLAGTNAFYGDGSVINRASITDTMTVSDTLIHKTRVLLVNTGAPPRFGPSNMFENARGRAAAGEMTVPGHYIAIMGPEIRADIMKMGGSTNLWVNVTQYQNAKRTYNGEVGDYLGLRIVETNFIPKFTLLGNKTTAATVGANAGGITGLTTAVGNYGGTLSASTTYGWKVTRINLQRGFEETISIVHTSGSGSGNNGMRFTFPSDAGYVYNLYFDTTQGGGGTTDAGLSLAQRNIAAGAVVDVLAVPTAGKQPPANLRSSGAGDPAGVHPVYVLGAEAIAWVGLQDLQTKIVTGASKSDPLDQTTVLGYKFMAKACRLDETRILRLELPSNF